ncbi:MAG: carbohydrate ABC transporter permease [Treponema sp.]|jgi:raffinose/stachyose/melibiose transport system permease protein|nr:carbohydrate ABC transporter permease [Treponema sp.]
MYKEKTGSAVFSYIILSVAAVVFLMPILLVLMNSFKGTLYISDAPFTVPSTSSFVKFDNYTQGIVTTRFPSAFCWSLFITVLSVGIIVLFSSMTGWYITRMNKTFGKWFYYIFVFAMIVPFQMVMFPLTKVANMFHLDNPIGILIVYLGFGAGQSVFLFCGFVKSVPITIEEAATIDGCTPISMFFNIILPMLTPIAITVAIINAMWIWNDFLLPFLIIGSEYRTIPVAVQYLRTGHGSINMGHMMAVIIIAIIPIVAFYFSCQKYIIKGITAGSVKG